VETLAERIAREGPVNELDAVGWIVRLAKKLESLHSRGLAHGGVSPEAMKTASASRLSLGMLVPTGSARNRLEFRSPERLGTEAASPTDDTWCTATTLYTLLTGSSPFVGGNEDAIRQKIWTGTFAPLSTFDVGDDDLQHIIEAALTPSIANRTSSLAAFREALEGWHPDAKVRDLPPMVDEQPEDDDDDDARTVMRPVSAGDAVRALMIQREQAAAAAMRAAETAPPTTPASNEIASSTNEFAKAPAAPGHVVAHNHGLLEDDDENAKTSMISVPPLAMLGNRAPATVPAPPPVDIKTTPPTATVPSTGFGGMRAPGGPAARGGLAKATFVGGFSAKSMMEPAPPPRPPAPSYSSLGISRDAVIEDGDSEATVMREAPPEVLRKAKASIAPPVSDRKTPVDPTSAAVAAMTASSTAYATNPAPAMPQSSSSLASSSMFEDDATVDYKAEPRENNRFPWAESEVKEAPVPAATPALGQTPAAPAVPAIPQAPPTGLATSALTAPSTSGMVAPSALGSGAQPAPAPITTPAPLATAPVAAPPVVATNPQPPSALKGIAIGVGLALLIIVAVVCVYFFVLKR
jgi:hypothetical protein